MSQQINLYNPILLRQKKYFSAATMAQALGILLLGMLAFYGYARYQVASLQTATEQGATRLESAQARVGRLAQQFSPRAKSAELEQRIQQTETELKTLAQAQQALKQSGLLDSSGFSPYFQALARQIVDGLWLTQFTVGGGEMRISGRALQAQLVPTYIRRLSTEPALQGRQFSMLEMRQPAAAEGQEKKTANLPRYLEFTLQTTFTSDKPENKPGAKP
jgi:Tfp pilus assembly protein PilN